MNVEIGAEAAQFPEKEYINGFSVAVRGTKTSASLLAFIIRKYDFTPMLKTDVLKTPRLGLACTSGPESRL
jgi:hypothetical protein